MSKFGPSGSTIAAAVTKASAGEDVFFVKNVLVFWGGPPSLFLSEENWDLKLLTSLMSRDARRSDQQCDSCLQAPATECPLFAQNHPKWPKRNLSSRDFKCGVVSCYHSFTLARSIYMLYFFSLKQEAARHKKGLYNVAISQGLYNVAISMCFSCCKQPTVTFFFSFSYSRFFTLCPSHLTVSLPSFTVAQVRQDLGMSRTTSHYLRSQTNKLNL